MSKIKYKDNMTPQEQANLIKEIDLLDECYNTLAACNPMMGDNTEEEFEDETAVLNKAALNMGKPYPLPSPKPHATMGQPTNPKGKYEDPPYRS